MKQRHQCPNCGAALGIPEDHEAFFRCGYCGTVIEDRARSNPEPDVADVELTIGVSSIDPEQLSQYRGGARAAGRGVAVLGLLGVVAAGAVAIGISQSVDDATDTIGGVAVGTGDDVDTSDGGGSREASLLGISSVTTADVVLSDDDSSPDVVLVGYGTPSRTAYVDLDAEPPLRWSDETAVEANTFSPFVTTGDLVVLSARDELVARNRSTGAIAWEAPLTDVVQHNICPGCVQVFGDALVTLSADGVLRATDLASGDPRWEVTLAATPRQVVDLGGRPTVLDSDQGAAEAQLLSFDPTTGEELQRRVVGCPDATFGGIDAPTVYAPMVPSGDGRSVWVVGGTFTPCAQRFDAGQDGAAVTVPLEADPGPRHDHENLLLADGDLYLASRTTVRAVDGETGQLVLATQVEDAEVVPLAAADGVLVLAARSTRGSSSWELRGLDVELGTTIWRFAVEAADPFDVSGRPVTGDGNWTAALTSGGVTVLQVFEEEGGEALAQPTRLVSQTIPLRSGTAGEPATIEVVGGVSAWTRVLAWRGDRVYVLTDTVLSVIDAVAGTVEQSAHL